MTSAKPEVTIGTKVATTQYRFGGSDTSYKITKIVRDTPTQWVGSDNTRYKKKDLRIIGDSYGTLTICTDKHLELNKVAIVKVNIRNILYDLSMARNKIEEKDMTRLNRALLLLEETKTLLNIK